MEARQPIVILGAGLAGLSAAHHLRERGVASLLYEKEDRAGGHTRSHLQQGFTFDEGPHISFTKDPSVQELFAKSAGSFHEFLCAQRNYYQGVWLKHPAICHLYGLPPETIERCLVDFIESQRTPREAPADYAQWLKQSFGTFFAESFAGRYTRKYWTMEPKEMSTDWVGPRVYAPTMEEVIRGALRPKAQALHYIQRCRYPAAGGYEAYTRIFRDGVEIETGAALVEVDVRRRRVAFADGRTAAYGQLISSIPLPVLVAAIPEAPSPVREAAQRLRCTSVMLVNVGVRRSALSDVHWLYIYDEDILCSRVSFPHMLAPANAPEGCGSIQAEIYYSPSRPLATADVLGKTLSDLKRVGLLRSDDEIVLATAQDVRFANVIFNHERPASVARIHAFLRAHDIHPCGRYGEWGYLWSDQAVLSGRRVAEHVSPQRSRAMTLVGAGPEREA